jgi:cytochrome P450
MKDAIEKHQSRSTDSEKDKDDVRDDETLLDHLVKLTADRTVLRDEILNIMIAGRDTIASVITFATYMLAINPAILAHLREEILSKVGPSARPTYDNIRDMKYLRAFINETLRLFPPIPFDVRQTINEATWPSPNPTEKPIYIPADTRF